MYKINAQNFPLIQKTAHAWRLWFGRKSKTNHAVNGLILLGLIFGLLTYGAFINMPPFGDNTNILIVLLNIDLVILLSLFVLVSRRLMALWVNRRKGAAGSNLHIRLVFVFSLLAAIPAVFMAVFSLGFFYFGIHGWLDERVRTAITESEAVALVYLEEHQQLIRADILAMTSDLNRQAAILSQDKAAMSKMLKTQSYLRNFSDVALLGADLDLILQEGQGVRFNLSSLTPGQIKKAKTGEVVMMTGDKSRIEALVGLENYIDTFIMVGRFVDPQVLTRVENVQKGVAQYRDVQKQSQRLQLSLTALYVLITCLLTLSAVWFGLIFARRLITPISALVTTAESVREGDLSARVDVGDAMDEFRTLGRAFNRMTQQIEAQQKELIDANDQMDFRRRFTETILGGVSTGIISLDEQGVITLANNASGALLQQDINALLGQKIAYLIPELMPLLDQAFAAGRSSMVTGEIDFRREDKAVRTFIVRIVIEQMEENRQSAIITFDDLTDIQMTQRKAAWADIARRIAHEIKNPLTPIQLAAERLNRKYRKGLNEKDQAVFDQCTQTITRHVDDIKTMVNAFADFAKMPDPVIKRDDILPLIKDCVMLQQTGSSKAVITLDMSAINTDQLIIPHDSQQIRQVLTNLIKNAVEAVEGQDEQIINIHAVPDYTEGQFYMAVSDNGPGFPVDQTHLLTEPYITHKEKGTGLGLAIVKKIVEDHCGRLLFQNETLKILSLKNLNQNKGAMIVVALPLE